MSSHVRLLLLTCAALVLAVAPARADDKADAERYFRSGERAYNAGQYSAAAEAFEEAYKRLPLPAIAFSAAQAHRLQYVMDRDPQRLKRSVELYRTYLEQQKSGGRVPDAARSLAELEPKLEAMERQGMMAAAKPEPKTTRLMVTSQVDGARGSIDGETGKLPLVAEVAPGEHTVRVEADGHVPVTVKAVAVEGALVPVEVDLTPRPAVLDLQAEEGARVTLDGRPLGTAPLRGVEVPAGKHLLAVARRGRRPVASEIELQRGERRAVSVDLRATTRRTMAWWVTGAAGALAIGAGVTGTVALLADSDASELADQQRSSSLTLDELERYDDARARRDDARTATWILGGAAVVVGATAIVMFVFDDPAVEPPAMSMEPEKKPERPAALQPMAWIDAGGGGVALGGRF